MHQGARTDLCGGRGATRVPTATWNEIPLTKHAPKGFIGFRIFPQAIRHDGALIGIFASRIWPKVNYKWLQPRPIRIAESPVTQEVLVQQRPTTQILLIATIC